MQLKKLLEKWDLTSLKIKAPFLEMEWQPNNEDKTAAWELYIELITRAATQRLAPDEGDEAAVLKSIYELFSLTRDTINRNGRINFTRIAVVVLNQKIPTPLRPSGTRARSRGTSTTQPSRISGRSCVISRRTFATTRACWPTWPTSRTLPIWKPCKLDRPVRRGAR